MLKVGQVIRLTKDDTNTWEVLRVNSSAATVRSMSKRHSEFVTYDGTEVEFDAPGKRMIISPNSIVEVVQDVQG